MRVAILLLGLAACQPALAPVEQACGASALKGMVGLPASALAAFGPWTSLRLIRPGQAVTEDYSEGRLNVQLDGQDRITALTCG